MARPISSSDDELDRLALRVANDPDQFPRLESAMRYVVAKIASTIYGTYCHDRDDMRQLTSIGLWEAVVSYSPARGRFRSYAWVVIHRRLCDALNWGGRPRPAETSLDQAEDEWDLSYGIEPSFETEVLDRIESEEVLGALSLRLTPVEHIAFEGLLRDDRSLETAHRSGIKIKAVDNARCRIMLKARELGAELSQAA